MITLYQAKQLYTSPLLRHSSHHEYMIRETNRSFESDLFNEPVKTVWMIRSRMIRSVTDRCLIRDALRTEKWDGCKSIVLQFY